MMGAGELDPDRGAIQTCMQLGSDRAKALSQDSVRTTMEKTDRLSIALDRHPSYDSFRGGFDDFDPHLATKFTTSAFHEEVHVVLYRAIGRHVAMIWESTAMAHSLT